MKVMGEITTLVKATSKTLSLRTTVPKNIVNQFGLKEGDKLNWELRVDEGRIIIVATPLKG